MSLFGAQYKYSIWSLWTACTPLKLGNPGTVEFRLILLCCGSIRWCVSLRHFDKLCIGPKCKVLNISTCLNWKQAIKWWVWADFILLWYSVPNFLHWTASKIVPTVRHNHFHTSLIVGIIHTITWAGDRLFKSSYNC